MNPSDEEREFLATLPSGDALVGESTLSSTWAAGAYLVTRLATHGCDMARGTRLLFASGQLATCLDAWDAARLLLERFIQGQPDPPAGPMLSALIVRILHHDLSAEAASRFGRRLATQLHRALLEASVPDGTASAEFVSGLVQGICEQVTPWAPSPAHAQKYAEGIGEELAACMEVYASGGGTDYEVDAEERGKRLNAARRVLEEWDAAAAVVGA